MRLIDPDATESYLLDGRYVIESPKHGHWIMHTSELYPSDSTMECDQCHHEQTIFMTDDTYCPNCGAKMDEVIEV